MKHNRTHKKIGQNKAKKFACKDISDYCKENNSFYTMNYISYEARIWDCLKLFNPIVLSINTNKL